MNLDKHLINLRKENIKKTNNIFIIVSFDYYLPSKINYPYVQKYIIGIKNIKGRVCRKCYLKLSENFDIGANKNEYAVFKNP